MGERTWQDLLWSRDPKFLREAAALAESLGRYAWADAMRDSADDCESLSNSTNGLPPKVANQQEVA